ncbi:MAG: hypothetical protein [Circular genetic element sp.]|nr:MAG: hypothetical protein [Circular genetic element sp.]
MQNNLFYVNSYTDPFSGQDVILNKPYINIARDLSRMNSKNEEVTTRDGHVLGYMCTFKIITAAEGGVTLYSAPNTWKMRNSFRKFHAYRDIMYENAGVDMKSEVGRYGHTMRPLLDSRHVGDYTDTLTPLTVESDQTSVVFYDEGDWTYTELATTPIYTAIANIAPDEKWADNFNIHICEENQVVDDTARQSGYYTSVGMIHSYNLDRMEVVTPGADSVIDGPSNPLAALISSGNQATGEVLEIAIEEELEAPPYDLADAGNSINEVVQGFSKTPSTGGTVMINAFVPAGLCRLFISDISNASTIEVTVLGKVLCKDLS